MPFTAQIALLIGVMSLLSAGALPIVEAITLGSLAGQPAAMARSGCGARSDSWRWCSGAACGSTTSRYRRCPRCWSRFIAGHACRRARFAPGQASRGALKARAALHPGSARAALAAGFCNAVAHGALYAFLSLHLEALGYSATAIGMLVDARRGRGDRGLPLPAAAFPALCRSPRSSWRASAAGVVRFLMIGWAAGPGG